MTDPTLPDPLYHWDEEPRDPLEALGLVDLLFFAGLVLAFLAVSPFERLRDRIRSKRHG